MSQVSCGHLSLFHPTGNPLVELVKGAAQLRVVLGLLGNDLSQPWAQEPIISAGAKQGGSRALPCHPIAMGPGNSLDQTVQAKASQVIAHLPHGHVIGRSAQERGPMAPQVAAGETTG